MQPADIAEIVHEMFKVLNLKTACRSELPQNHGKDLSWPLTSSAYKQGLIVKVKAGLEPDATPSSVHEAWNFHMVDAGWIHGPLRITKRLIDPDIGPFGALSEEKKLKIRLLWHMAILLNSLEEAIV